MKRRMKFSLTTILAITAIATALITKANVLTREALIIGCFKTVTLTDWTGTPSLSPNELSLCDEIKDMIVDNSYIYLKAISNTTRVPPIDCPGSIAFCCVELEPFIGPIPVPTFDLGDGVQQKYRLRNLELSVRCRD